MLSFLNLQRPLCLNFKLKAFLALKFRIFEKKLAALSWLQSLSYFVFLVVFSSFCDPFLQIYSRFCDFCLPDIFLWRKFDDRLFFTWALAKAKFTKARPSFLALNFSPFFCFIFVLAFLALVCYH